MTVGAALSQGAEPSAQSLRVLQERAAAQRPGWLYYAGWAASLALVGCARSVGELRPLARGRSAGSLLSAPRRAFPRPLPWGVTSAAKTRAFMFGNVLNSLTPTTSHDSWTCRQRRICQNAAATGKGRR